MLCYVMLLLIRKHFSSSFSVSACFVPQNLATSSHHHFPELVHPHFLDESVEWRVGVCTLALLLYNLLFFFFMLAQSFVVFPSVYFCEYSSFYLHIFHPAGWTIK